MFGGDETYESLLNTQEHGHRESFSLSTPRLDGSFAVICGHILHLYRV